VDILILPVTPGHGDALFILLCGVPNLWIVMASDIWGFSTAFIVFACVLVVCGLTTEIEEGIDDGSLICIFTTLLVKIVR